MSSKDVQNFRRMCGQYRWLAVFMVVSVGLLLAAIAWIFPLLMILTHKAPPRFDRMAAISIMYAPAACYLFGVWSIGQALGEVSKGRLIQAALPSALRRVGISLGVGGVASVFLVSNLMRLVGYAKGGYLHFDVPGMTLGMIGGALFLLGRVMDQALAAQAELDEMI
jgi:hypothetical protein